jgi:hypothetical protein
MTSSWQFETGHLVCHWSEAGVRAPYHPGWNKRPLRFRVGTCRHFRILPPAAHLEEFPGFNPVPLTMIERTEPNPDSVGIQRKRSRLSRRLT